MMTFVAASLVASKVAWLIRKRPAAALVATFILFSLLLRTVALTYLDLAGPVYSTQLNRHVGGEAALPVFALIVLALMAVLAVAFRPAHLRTWRPNRVHAAEGSGDVAVGDSRRSLTFIGFCIGAALLYADMLLRGPVPLFAGIDRLEYNAVAGPLHGGVLRFSFLVGATLGYMFVRPRTQGQDFDFRFLGLYAVVLAYFALTGHRFSAFYVLTSFFVMPLAAIPALATVGELPAPPLRSRWKAFVCSSRGLAAGAFAAGVGLLALVLNSVVRVRAYGDPAGLLRQRVLVQPVELWWVTWHETVRGVRWPFREVWSVLFVDPIDPARNTSIQWLMVKTLGYPRASEVLGNGTQYAGGYPEVLFDLLGPWLALLAVAAFAVPTVLLLRLIVRCACEGRFWTMFMAAYVFYGLSLLYIGGMLNFLTTWTYWGKLALLAAAYLIEREGARPWWGRARGVLGPRREANPVSEGEDRSAAAR